MVDELRDLANEVKKMIDELPICDIHVKKCIKKLQGTTNGKSDTSMDRHSDKSDRGPAAFTGTDNGVR